MPRTPLPIALHAPLGDARQCVAAVLGEATGMHRVLLERALADLDEMRRLCDARMVPSLSQTARTTVAGDKPAPAAATPESAAAAVPRPRARRQKAAGQ